MMSCHAKLLKIANSIQKNIRKRKIEFKFMMSCHAKLLKIANAHNELIEQN